MRPRALEGLVLSTQNYLLLALVVPEITLLGHSCGLGHHLQEVSSLMLSVQHLFRMTPSKPISLSVPKCSWQLLQLSV